MRSRSQLRGAVDRNILMQIQCVVRGGIVVLWAAGRLTLLFDARDAWFTWDGQLVHPIKVGSA